MLVVVLVLMAVLFVGFRSWAGAQAAGVDNFPGGYGGIFALLARGPGSGAGASFGGGFGGCCGAGRGGCPFWAGSGGSGVLPGGGAGGGSGSGWPGIGAGMLDVRALEQAALEVYRQQTGDTGRVEIRVRDFGCHVQAEIYKDGRLVKSYSYRQGQWQEIY